MTKKEFRYCVEDVLDVKYRGNCRENKKIARMLLDSANGCRYLQCLSSFVVGRTLVVIKDGTGPGVERMLLLDARSHPPRVVEGLKQSSKLLT